MVKFIVAAMGASFVAWLLTPASYNHGFQGLGVSLFLGYLIGRWVYKIYIKRSK